MSDGEKLTILLATTNRGKIAELGQLFADLPINLLPLSVVLWVKEKWPAQLQRRLVAIRQLQASFSFLSSLVWHLSSHW